MRAGLAFVVSSDAHVESVSGVGRVTVLTPRANDDGSDRGAHPVTQATIRRPIPLKNARRMSR
jgi:hypothetical protein